jgi:5-methylcytosine-specific restriction protein A
MVVAASYAHVVTLAQITAAAVETAMTEFDRVGRRAFLRSTGFGRSRSSYFIGRGDRLYDSKALVAYAHRVNTRTPLAPADLTDTEELVARRLEELGFQVLHLPRIDWTREEIILACAEVEANGWRQLDRNDQRVAALSRLLQSPGIHPVERRGPDFRNPAGVARKTADIATRVPGYPGKKTNGNHLDVEVLLEFRRQPALMHQAATAIREELSRASARLPVTDLDLDGLAANEGGVLYRRHLRRERDPELRTKKIKDARRRGVPIACEVCSFDFARVYGPRGADFIECHHRVPLHVSGPIRTRIADLALLCSNCHRMIHRATPWLTVEELQALVTDQLSPR